MPLGSSSATPVISPGPTRASGCSFTRPQRTRKAFTRCGPLTPLFKPEFPIYTFGLHIVRFPRSRHNELATAAGPFKTKVKKPSLDKRGGLNGSMQLFRKVFLEESRG